MPMNDPECGHTQTVKGHDRAVTIVHRFPKALAHHYPLPALGSSVIPVYRGNYDYDGARCRGIIRIELEPRPNLIAHGVHELIVGPEHMNSLENPQPQGWADRGTLTLPTKKVPRPAKTARLPRALKSPASVSSRADYLQPIVVGNPTDLESVTFYILNGWFGSDGLSNCYDGTERRGRIDVVLDAWQLRIEPRGDLRPNELRRHQRSSGQSAVTHVGRIRRDDGGPFHASDAMKILKIVETLTGFALGRATAVVLPVGYRDGQAAWALYECNRVVHRPLGTPPFLDGAHTSAQMTELFRAGYATSKNALRWQVFENAMAYHYSAEHGATVKMKVLLPVSALQLISYAHLVQELPANHLHHLSHAQWKGLQTSSQLRKVLQIAGIDMSVPSHLSGLAKVQTDIADTSLPNPDALDCVVRMRNKVAHPKHATANAWTTEEWAETGFAATTMFNVAMLWWLNYSGRYLGKSSAARGYDDSTYVPWHIPKP